MTTNKLDVAASPGSTPHAAPPPQTSAVRLIVLLGLLAVAIGAYVYDHTVARPGVEAAEKKIGEFVDTRNRMGVKDGAPVTPAEIHKELGMEPTYVDKHNKDQYEVEYYCWWGPVPVLNMRRHYIAIVYVGDEPRRISAHYKNERPPREALPIIDPPPESTDSGPLPPIESADGKRPETSPAAEPAATAEPAAAKEK